MQRNSVPEKTVRQQKRQGQESVVASGRKVPSCSFLWTSIPASPEEGALCVLIRYELGFFFFCECLIPKSVLFFIKETATYQDENPEKEAQDAESMEEKEEMSKKQEGPEKDEESAESRSGKSKCLCVALNITQPFLAFT